MSKLLEFLDNRQVKVARLLALRTGRLYSLHPPWRRDGTEAGTVLYLYLAGGGLSGAGGPVYWVW